MAATLDHQLDSNDAWLPTRRHTDTAFRYRAAAPKVLVRCHTRTHDTGAVSWYSSSAGKQRGLMSF